jgi:hypothetical protein
MRALLFSAAIGTLAALVLLLSTGCSGQTRDGSPGGPHARAASTSEVKDLCNAQCNRSARCAPAGTPVDTICPQDCEEDLGNLATAIRSDIAGYLKTCYDNLECGKNDDRCLGDAVVATGEGVDAALHAPDVSSCLMKQKECHGTPGAFSDDTCGTMVALIAAKRAEAAHCFTLPCESIPPCLSPIFGP